jgi:hypothetical protein
LINSKKQINDNLLPVLVQSIKELFPESSSRTIKRQINDYIVAVQEETDADNTFLAEVKGKSAEEGANLVAIAKALVQLDIEELRNRQDMYDVSVQIEALPTKVDDAMVDRADMFLDDLDADLTAEPAPAPAPSPAPAPKPKKEDIVVADKLPYTQSLTDQTTLVWNGIRFSRTRSTFLKNNTKAEAVSLLNTLGINSNEWSSVTRGTSRANVKAFKEKAYDEFLINPRLLTVRNAKWFKE